MHEHCTNPDCGAILRAGAGIEFFGFDGWICSRCRWQLTYPQLEALMPRPKSKPSRWRWLKR